MKADLAFCGCMILWAVGFIGAELGVTPSDIKELVPTMTPTTITILAVAAYFAVGYGWSVVAYVKQARYREAWQEKNPDIRPGDYNDWQIPASPATVACFVSLAWLPFGLALCIGYTIYGAFVFATRPHRYFAALVKKLNTPAPVQVSGAFAGEKGKVRSTQGTGEIDRNAYRLTGRIVTVAGTKVEPCPHYVTYRDFKPGEAGTEKCAACGKAWPNPV
jgi:hypothetical protein